MIGFGISTQNRKKLFFETLEAVYKYAPDKSVIVINDDGSTDGTKEEVGKWIADRAAVSEWPLVSLTGSDEIVGVAKSKTNLVQRLLTATQLSDVFLIEDDVLPLKDMWWDYFLKCAWEHKQAHLLYLPSDFKYGKIIHTTEGDNPIVWKLHCSGLVMYFRYELLEQMKGFENRFGRYGYDHNELTARCLIAQMQAPTIYPHVIRAESEHALLARDIEAEQLRNKIESSTSDDSPNGMRTKTILARQNKQLYDELMTRYNAAYMNVKDKSAEEKLAHRTRYYFKKPS